MKKTRFFCVLLTLILLLQSMCFAVEAQEETESNPSVTQGCKTIDAASPLYGSDKMLETSQAAMLYEVGSDTTMYAWNPDVRMDPASFVKIITCLVVMENCDINEEIVVTETAMSYLTKKQSTLGLIPGEKFTVDMMLYGLMVGSANDAAVVLAEHVAGSQENFVAMMNEYAQKIGCKDSYFMNAHGLYNDQQYTTARDVVRMVSHAMQDEQFMNYFGTTAYKIAATEYSDIRRVETTNYLATVGTELYFDSRVTGGRTAINNEGKRSLVVTASSNGLTYIAVVIAASPVFSQNAGDVQWFGSYEEAADLLKLGFESHSVTQVLYQGQILSQFPVNNGRNAVSLGPVNTAEVILPAATSMDDLTLRFNIPNGTLEAPIEVGQQISSVEVWYGTVCVAWSPVVTMNGSEFNDGSLLQPNRYGGGGKAWIIILIVLIVAVVGFFAVVFGMRIVRTMQNARDRMRHRRRRSDRRRTK